MAPRFHPAPKDVLAGQPAVRVQGENGAHGFDGVLVRWHNDANGLAVATVWGGRKGAEAYRTIAADRVIVKRSRRALATGSATGMVAK